MRTNPKPGSDRSGVSRTGRIRSKPHLEQKAPKTTESGAASPDSVPTSDDIAKLAYAIWEARGAAVGTPEEDWLRAEQEILKRS